MRRAGVPAALIAVAAVVGLAGPAAVQQELEIENLADVREVNVVVEDLAEDAEDAGLTRRGLRDAAEATLEGCGIRLGGSSADLYVNVATHLGSTGLYAYYARVSLQQMATIEGNQLRALLDTWDMASLGAVGGANLAQVEEVVVQLVELFCQQYFEVNEARE